MMKEKALELCKKVHSKQIYYIDGKEVPYYNHCMIVAKIIEENAESELDKDYAETVALLHDTLEDTSVTYADIEKDFGKKVADGVLALTKNRALPHEDRLDDSLSRIAKLGSREVAAVKMADRICNLGEIPAGWSKEKVKDYLCDAIKIKTKLEKSSGNIATLLGEAIEDYKKNFILGGEQDEILNS